MNELKDQEDPEVNITINYLETKQPEVTEEVEIPQQNNNNEVITIDSENDESVDSWDAQVNELLQRNPNLKQHNYFQTVDDLEMKIDSWMDRCQKIQGELAQRDPAEPLDKKDAAIKQITEIIREAS